jgi:hypothetical protein
MLIRITTSADLEDECNSLLTAGTVNDGMYAPKLMKPHLKGLRRS